MSVGIQDPIIGIDLAMGDRRTMVRHQRDALVSAGINLAEDSYGVAYFDTSSQSTNAFIPQGQGTRMRYVRVADVQGTQVFLVDGTSVHTDSINKSEVLYEQVPDNKKSDATRRLVYDIVKYYSSHL